MKLDRNKPFGTNFPPGKHHYEQFVDGKVRYFNGDDFEVDPRTGKVIEDVEPVKKPVTKPKAPPQEVA